VREKKDIKMKKINISWAKVDKMVENICTTNNLKDYNISKIVGVSRGGLIPATLFAKYLNVREIYCFGMKSYCDTNDVPLDSPVVYQDPLKENPYGIKNENILIVDDISDRGETFENVKNRFEKMAAVIGSEGNIYTASLVCKPHTKFQPDWFDWMTPCKDWIVFPWEN